MARRVVPPTVEPMTAADVRLRLKYQRTDQDVAITEWITSARDVLERYLERGLLTQTWELQFETGSASSAPSGAVAALAGGESTESHVGYFVHNLTTYRTPRLVSSPSGAESRVVVDLPWAAPLQTVEAVADDDGIVDPATYAVDNTVEPARLYFASNPRGVCVVRYVVGFGDDALDVPANLRQVVLALVQQFFLFRATPPPQSALDATLQFADGYRVRTFA